MRKWMARAEIRLTQRQKSTKNDVSMTILLGLPLYAFVPSHETQSEPRLVPVGA